MATYETGMIFRRKGIANFWCLQLVERLSHSEYEIKCDVYDKHGGEYMGWAYRVYDKYRNRWTDSLGWMDEGYITTEYEPVGRLTELIVLGSNNVQAKAGS